MAMAMAMTMMMMAMKRTLFDHNIQIEIYKQFRYPNYKLVWRLLLRQINLLLS